MGDLGHLDTPLELKTVDQGARIISGYAAVIGNVDRGGDVIDAKAFDKTLAEKRPGDVAVFIGHNAAELPIGMPVTLQVDGKGLYSETYIYRGSVGDDVLDRARDMLSKGKVLGMSIGYRARDGKMERRDGQHVRVLTDIDLVEYSFAAAETIMNPQALMTGIKQIDGLREALGSKQGDDGMPYRIEKHGDEFCVHKADDGKRMGCHDSEDGAKRQMAALYAAERGKTVDPATLPDTAFLYVEAGDKDERGYTVPQAKRHWPYRDADGAVDPDLLRKVADDIAEGIAPAPLATRVRRMLEQVEAGKTAVAEVDPPEWKAGAAIELRGLGYALLDLSERIAVDLAAMAVLGEDTKAGTRLNPAKRSEVKAILGRLQALSEWAETVERGEDGKAWVDRASRELDLLEIA